MIVALGSALPGRADAQQRVPETLGLDSLLDIKVSTAAKYAQRIGEVASSVTIVTAEDIRRYGYRALEDVFASIPGFYTSYDRNYSYVGVRGFSRPTDWNNRLLVLIDGNTLNEGIWGSAQVGKDLGIPMSGIERIEVVRGPGSAMYGTGAIFAVVNVITRTPETLVGTEVVAEHGSFGAREGQVLFGRRFARSTGVSLSAFWSESDGQDLYYPEFDSRESHGGVASNLDWERRRGVVAGVTKGGLRLHGRYASRTKAFPTGSYDVVFNSPGAETRDDYAFVEMNYDRELGPTRQLSTRAYYNWFNYDGGYPSSGEEVGDVVMYRDAGRYGAAGTEGTLRWDIASGNRLTIGGEVRRHLNARYYEGYDGAELDSDFNVPSTVLSAYLQDEHQLTSTVSLLGGVRYDRYSAEVDALSPRAAVIFAPTRRTSLKLLYGEAFRAPSIYEAEASSYQYQRNPDLQPERAHTAELVWQQHVADGLLGTVSLFQYDMHGLIDLTADPVSGMYTYRNVGEARSRGVEAGLEVRLGRAASAYANYTQQRTLDEDGMPLTNSPTQLMKAGIGLEPAPWFRPALQLRRESSRRTVYDTRTPAYSLADVNIVLLPLDAIRTAQHRRSGRRELLELSVQVRNAFDAEYATPGGVEHRQAGIRQDGRNVRMEARLRF